MNLDWDNVDELKQTRPALVLEALTAGDAEAFKRAINEGFDVNVMAECGGNARTALHHAAAAGDVAVLRHLVDHGAEPSLDVKDPVYGATPLGWAEFFDQPDAAAFLRDLS